MGRRPAETCAWKPAVPRAAGALFPRVVWQCFLINSLGLLEKILKTLQRREVSSLALSRLSLKVMWLSRTMGADVSGSMVVLDKSCWGELWRWQASGGHGGWQQGVAGEDSDGGPGWRNNTGSCSKGRGMARRQHGVARRLCLWLQLGVGHAGVTRQPGRVVVQPEFPALRGGSDAIPVFFKMKLGQ